MELTDGFKNNIVETGRTLRGVQRRLFFARTVQSLGNGGQRRAEKEFGWNRVTIRKGMHELRSGISCCDAFSARGRARAEERLPNLLTDIQDIAKGFSQTDPQFRTRRFVHASDRGRTSPTTDRPQGLRGGGTANAANVANQAQ